MKTKLIIPKGYRRLRLGETLEDKDWLFYSYSGNGKIKPKNEIYHTWPESSKKRVGQTYNPFFTKKT